MKYKARLFTLHNKGQ